MTQKMAFSWKIPYYKKSQSRARGLEFFEILPSELFGGRPLWIWDSGIGIQKKSYTEAPMVRY